MPRYDYSCASCGQTTTLTLSMKDCSSAQKCPCGGDMKRLLSADFQTIPLPYHLLDGNKMYGGRRVGTRDVYSTKTQDEYFKKKDDEYEKKHRPSQSRPLPELD